MTFRRIILPARAISRGRVVPEELNKCPVCKGKGTKPDQDTVCGECLGSGYVDKEE